MGVSSEALACGCRVDNRQSDALVHPGQEQGGVLHAPGNKKAPDDAGAFEVTTLKSED
jgi:hypothetical protein